MARATANARDGGTVEELHSGDRMTQEEFHRIYSRMPEDYQAELVGGVVFVASPLKRPHSTYHLRFGSVFDAYSAHTPGVEAGDNATIVLGDEDEPQPDLFLRILPEYGGQSRNTDDEYIADGPELLCEIAHSSRAIDLHDKYRQYRKFRVLEYIVVCLRPLRLHWFDLTSGNVLPADGAGILRSIAFPGLWIDGEALLRRDYHGLMAALRSGLESPEHAAFVGRLAAGPRP